MPQPGYSLVVPQPSSSSPGWCFLRDVRPSRSTIISGFKAQDAFRPRWPSSPEADARSARGCCSPSCAMPTPSVRPRCCRPRESSIPDFTPIAMSEVAGDSCGACCSTARARVPLLLTRPWSIQVPSLSVAENSKNRLVRAAPLNAPAQGGACL